MRARPIEAAIEARDAVGFVHVGPPDAPASRYLRRLGDGASGLGDSTNGTGDAADRTPTALEGRSHHAFAVVDGAVLTESAGAGHAAERLADGLSDRSGTLLVPPEIPHDAALHLEEAGFELASSDVVERARSRKTPDERDAIERAQEACAAGLQRAATGLAEATDVDGHLFRAERPLTPERLRRAVDAAMVAADGYPCGRTTIEVDGASNEDADDTAGDPIAPGEPVVLRLRPRGPTGYHGALTRTLVPGTDGGWERRAHVAVESALRSARTMLAAGSATVREVEAELVAEVGSFGFAESATASVAGVGLEAVERPRRGTSEIESGAVVALETGVESAADGTVRLGDTLAVGDGDAEWLAPSSRALDPATLVE